MSRARDLLRQAALEFADRVYEILRTELVDEVRRGIHVDAAERGVAKGPREEPSSAISLAPEPAPSDQEPQAPAPLAIEAAEPRASGAMAKVLAHVRANPGVRPVELLSALRLNRKTVFDALRDAVASGSLRKEGRAPAVAYHANAETAETETTVAAAPRVRDSSAALVERIVAFVSEHPGCRYGEIEKATGATKGPLQNGLRAAKELGRVRMEGTRIKARYFPVPPESAALTGPVDPERITSESPGIASEPPPAPTVQPPVGREPKTSAADRGEAERLLEELDDALGSDVHAVRLGLVLQAIVAEVRVLQPRIASTEPVAILLDRAMRTMTAVQRDRQLSYINGLRRTAVADWPLVARRARDRLAAFDRDAGEVPQRAAPPAPRLQRERESTSRVVAAEPTAFAALRTRLSEGPLVLVGGIKKNEVLEQLREQHGLDAEWTAGQGNNARAFDAFLERLRRGRIGAVVVLEGLFGTTQVQSVVAALKANAIPFAYGDRAGTASLRRALTELDVALADDDGSLAG